MALMSRELLLDLHNLSCGYQQQNVVQDISLHLNAGDIGCLLGPSGCGKTTTLRAIAGFEPLQSGRIGMVFQDYALFPHLTVADNIAFGIRDQHERSNVVAEMLELVNLQALAD